MAPVVGSPGEMLHRAAVAIADAVTFIGDGACTSASRLSRTPAAWIVAPVRCSRRAQRVWAPARRRRCCRSPHACAALGPSPDAELDRGGNPT